MQAGDGSGQRGEVTPKHVWVNGDRLASERSPGILLDWRVVDGGRWEAYVVWADGGGNVKVRSYVEWVDQDKVSPRA